MRRAALFALAFSLGQGENLFSGSCGIRCRQYFLLSGICDTRCRQCFLLFWRCGIRYRQCLLLSAVCGIRYRQCLLILALWYSVPERASYGTEYAFGAQNRLLGYATHFQRHSVQKTGVSGTEGIFGAQNSLPWYAAHHGYSVQPPSLVRNRSLGAKKGHHRNNTKKTGQILRLVLFSSGGWTRTNDLRVMSPTSYQLLYPAMFGNTKVGISFEFTKFFSLLLQILRSAARFLPAPRLFSSAEELSH